MAAVNKTGIDRFMIIIRSVVEVCTKTNREAEPTGCDRLFKPETLVVKVSSDNIEYSGLLLGGNKIVW